MNIYMGMKGKKRSEHAWRTFFTGRVEFNACLLRILWGVCTFLSISIFYVSLFFVDFRYSDLYLIKLYFMIFNLYIHKNEKYLFKKKKTKPSLIELWLMSS